MSVQEDFFKKWGYAFINATRFKNLYPSVMLAQAAIESGYGKSSLTSDYNNLFGIKADKSWDGEKILLKTREVVDGKNIYIDDYFRVYNKKSDSVKDRIDFLKRFDRYIPVFQAKNPYDQAQALQDAGYATDPDYAKVITNVIDKYKLKKYDKIKEVQNLAIISASSILLLIITYNIVKRII